MQETLVWYLGGEDPLEKGLATHSSILAWRIPWTEEPGRIQSVGSQRVGHNWATELNWSTTVGFPDGLAGKESACNAGEDAVLIPGSQRSPGGWKWQPTPVFLPEKFHGQRSLAGYSPWGHRESDMTERLMHACKHSCKSTTRSSNRWSLAPQKPPSFSSTTTHLDCPKGNHHPSF